MRHVVIERQEALVVSRAMRRTWAEQLWHCLVATWQVRVTRNAPRAKGPTPQEDIKNREGIGTIANAIITRTTLSLISSW